MDSNAICMLMICRSTVTASQTECLSVRIVNCMDAISDLMFSSRLQLNPSKTEVMWCSSDRRALELSLEKSFAKGHLFERFLKDVLAFVFVS